jgi:hypothetical protein
MIMGTPEPGLDRHEWESELASMEDELRDSPTETLSSLANLVGRMLEERGYNRDDPVGREGEEREVVAEFQAAREVADRVDHGEGVDPGDVGDAIQGLRELFDFLIAERESP